MSLPQPSENTVALVTGASSGIGADLARTHHKLMHDTRVWMPVSQDTLQTVSQLKFRHSSVSFPLCRFLGSHE